MLKYIGFLVSISLIVFSCDTTHQKSSNSKKLPHFVLQVQDIFSGEKVNMFLLNKGLSTGEANQLFMKGIKSFKNDKNLDSAIYHFKESILIKPIANTYYELGNAFLEKKEYLNAIKSYGIAEQLGFEPYSKILYNSSCVYSLMNNVEMSGKYLEYALQSGYSNMHNIYLDKDLNNLKKTEYFSLALTNGLNGMSNPEVLFWQQFKRLFPKLNQPIILDPLKNDVPIETLGSISYDFEKFIAEMRDDKFSREVSKGFYYYGLLAENANYVAVIYLVKEVFYDDEAPLVYRLATFDNQGKLIDKREIAGNNILGEPVRFAKIKPDLTISIDIFKLIYEKDPLEFGYEANKIINKSLVGKEQLSINTDGKIILLNKV